MQPSSPHHGASHRGRWKVAASSALALTGYLLALNSGILNARGTVVLNDVVWTIFGFAAAAICFTAANTLEGRERLAWRLVALGCLLWFAGQCVWNYYELGIGKLPAFPHWMQALYIAYPCLLTVGLLALPKPADAPGITVRRGGNLGLIMCTLAVILTIAVTEPAAQSQRSLFSMLASLLHCVAYAGACMTALYLLWSYRWQSAYWPLVLIAIGSGIHTAAFITDLHGRLAGTYGAYDWVNAAWLVALASVACAAYEYAWDAKHRPPKDAVVLLARERWLEATMPALLIFTMIGMAVFNTEWITSRVIYVVASVGVIFATTLGFREAWIQREEQRLVAELRASRNSLLDANLGLSRSEQHIRNLNAELEQRVSERTAELQSAYRELESFSYAVAHDIKAPLRAVNAFGSLLIEEHGSQLDERALSYVERMRRGALNTSQLVDDLLAYTRIERLELQVHATDTATLIDDCIAEQRDEIAKLGAQVAALTQPITLHTDGAALTQALRNLLQNALKFSQHAQPPRISIATVRIADRVQITVADNGIGFDMQYHDRIFAMFQRLHQPHEYAGTGIGLAIARKATERMGGRLWAQSRPNEGATFYIELPITGK